MRRLFSVSAAVMAAAATFAQTAQPETAPVALATVEMNGWSTFSSNLSVFCQSSGIPFALTGLSGRMGPAIYAPNLTGIDVTRPVRLYALRTSGKKPATVLALPLTDDGTVYLGALRECFQSEMQNGTATVLSDPSGAIHEGSLSIVVAGGTAWVSDRTVLAQAAAKAAPAGMQAQAPGDIRIAVDVQALLPLIEANTNKAHRAMTTPPPGAPGMPADPAAIVDAEMQALVEICRQVRRLDIGIRLNGDGGTLTTTVEALPDTPLASILHQQHPPSARYTALIPADAFFGCAGGGLAGLNQLAKPYGELMARIYSAMPGLSGASDAMRGVMSRMLGIYAGDYAVAVMPDARSNGVLFAEIVALKDPAKAGEILREGMSAATNFYQQAPFGLDLTSLPARVYAGATITSFRYRPTAADPANPAMAPMMMLAPFLQRMTVEQTIVGQDLIMTIGRVGGIDQIVDRVRSNNNTPRFYRNARQLFGESAAAPAEISHLSLSAALPQILKLMPSVNPQMLATLPPPGQGIGTLTLVRDNSAVWVLRVTPSEVRALMQSGPVLQQAVMSAMMGGMMGGPGAGMPNARPRPPKRANRPPAPPAPPAAAPVAP